MLEEEEEGVVEGEGEEGGGGGRGGGIFHQVIGVIVSMTSIFLIPVLKSKEDPPPSPGQKLLDAIKSGNMKAVDVLLNDHQKDEHKQISQDHLSAALLEACRAGWKFFVHKLVRSGATVCSEQNKNCTTALHIAAQHGFLDIVNFLLHKGADVNAVDENLNTALILAINPASCTEILNMLLANGAEVNAQNSEGMTALMRAVEARDVDAIRILILARADDKKRNSKGQTSTDIAMDSGISEIFKFIKYRKREKTRLCFFKSALSKAVLENNIEAVKILVDCVHRDIKFMSKCNTDYERANRATLDELVHSMCLAAHRQKKPDMVKLEIAQDLLESVSYEGNNSKLDVTSLLKKATQDGLYELVELLCKYEDFERHSDTTDHPALVTAAEKGWTDILKLLLTFTPVPTDSGYNKDSALFSAFKNNHIDCADILLQKGEFSNQYLYNIACNLITQGLYKALDHLVFFRNDEEFTQSLLNLAVVQEVGEPVQILINRGADVNARHNGAKVALVVALECGKRFDLFKMVTLLIESGANVNRCLHDKSPLVCAISKGHKIIRYLLEKGADANEVGDEMGNTPLMAAIVQRSNLRNVYYPFDVVKLLLDFGADPNKVNFKGDNALHLAVAQQTLDVVSKLLEAGADPNIVNAQGNNALHLAVAEQKLEVVSKLLEAGADSNKVNRQGDIALHLAVTEQTLDVVSKLLEAGADPNKVNRQGDTALHLALLEAGANPNKVNSEGNNALYLAVAVQKLEVVSKLLEAGANPNIVNSEGNNALHLAVTEQTLEVVSKLLDAGAELELPDSGGRTPLLIAAASGEENIIVLLKRYGANTAVVDNDGNTALSLVLQTSRTSSEKNLATSGSG
ncbi:ankyrin-3 [Plakobranchus ocellatus]|uniref:Ankyrin-3 n=1 Tax=Plakobranchus ocellatus TaxID=259542 RepID=A0AAV4D8L0_9GAST|nr:ankyrin-3 [Plakobranchus ocellatus]